MIRKMVSAAVLALVASMSNAESVATPAPTLPADLAAQYRLAWQDEFDGDRLDESRWHYRTDSKHWSTQLPANVTVKDGLLRIALKKEDSQGKAYTGGGVISKQAFRYGYYEARFKCPPGAGWHTSFWMMAHDVDGPERAAPTRPPRSRKWTSARPIPTI